MYPDFFYNSRPFCKEEQDVYTAISLYQNQFKHFQTTGKDFKIRPSAIENSYKSNHFLTTFPYQQHFKDHVCCVFFIKDF